MTPLFSTALLRTQSDERLVRLAGEGQELAFEAIVERYRRPLERYCGRAVPRSRAEDVVQQALMQAWLALREGTEVRSLKPWLYRIVRTTMLDMAEAPGYGFGELQQSLLSSHGPESELEQRAIMRRTLASVAALPVPQREALLRTAFEGQSRAQIAEALGVSEGAVRQLLHRARASLRAAATALTPLPLVSWLVSSGSGSVAGTVLEGGASGSLGIAGIAKASAILATAGVVATGSGGVRDDIGATNARAGTPKRTILHRRKVETAVVTRPTAVRATPVAPDRAEGTQEVGDDKQGGSQARDEKKHDSEQGDSGESARQNGDGEQQTARPAGEGRDEQAPDEPAPQQESDSGDGGDQPSGSGSDDRGD